MSKNIVKSIRKNVSGKYSEKPIDHTKQLATDALKTALKTAVQKPAEAAGDLIGNKIGNKITKIFQQNNSETVTKEYDK